MKYKVQQKHEDFYIPMLKFNWFSNWKIVNLEGFQYKLYNSFSEYFRNPKVEFCQTSQEAEDILKSYQIFRKNNKNRK